MSSQYQVPEVDIPDSKDIKEFGLQNEVLSFNQSCWLVLGKGVVRGWVENVKHKGKDSQGDVIFYDVNTYISDDRKVHEDMPMHAVFSLDLDGDNNKEARREKYLRVCRYFVSWTVYR